MRSSEFKQHCPSCRDYGIGRETVYQYLRQAKPEWNTYPPVEQSCLAGTAVALTKVHYP